MDKTRSGYSARELFKKGLGYVYEDFTLLNAILADIDKQEISLKTDLGKGVTLETPIIAAPMDTVTNAALCIALALQGGIGAIHYKHMNSNNLPDIDAQISEIEKVKRYLNGFIVNPIVVSPNMTIAEAIQLGEIYKVGQSTISSFPVTEDGNPNGILVGLLSKEDYTRRSGGEKVKNRMIPLEKIIRGEEGINLEEANRILLEARIRLLPIIDKKGYLKQIATRTDIDKTDEFPLATKDANNRLRVLFAVETHENPAYERLERGFAAGADGAVIDTSQGFTRYERNMILYIRKRYPDKLLIGGNVATREGARFLADLGVDAYRCGQGSGSICTTAGAIGTSRSSVSGIYECAKELRNSSTRTIADGGIKEVGDIVKALAVGAHAAMLGNLLAGTEEGPGEVFEDNGILVKVYRGMGSKEALGGMETRGYSRLPQGVSGKVRYRGKVAEWIPLIRDGIISGFHVHNCRSIAELHALTYSGRLRFEKRTDNATKESKVHDLIK